jgi:hypothetical protein
MAMSDAIAKICFMLCLVLLLRLQCTIIHLDKTADSGKSLIAPKSAPFCPIFGSQKPLFSPTFASKRTKNALKHGEKHRF